MASREINTRTIANLIGVLLTLALIACICIPFGAYHWMFSGGLPSDSDGWVKYATILYNLIMPPLTIITIIGIALTYRHQTAESRDRAIYQNMQSFKDTYFRIISLHVEKLSNIMSPSGSKTGINAIEELVDIYNNNIHRIIINKIIKDGDNGLLDAIKYWLQHGNDTEIKLKVGIATERKEDNEFIQITKRILSDNRNTMKYIFNESAYLNRFLSKYFNNLDVAIKHEIYAQGSNELYSSNGNAYGHFFRNMSMMLDHLVASNDQTTQSFAKLFRAQLSRSEIALLVIYNFGSNPSESFRKNTTQLNLFDGYEDGDIFSYRIHSSTETTKITA